MNILNECTKKDVELIEKAGVIIEDKDYNHVEVGRSIKIVVESSLLQRLQRCKKGQMSAFCHPKF